MRKYLDIHLATQTIDERSLEGREVAEAGRYLIARTLLEQGIAEGLEERPLEVDPYADEDWVGGYWDYYHFEFKNFTSRQCHSVFLNRLYMDSVADILREPTDIRCLINFGSFSLVFDREHTYSCHCERSSAKQSPSYAKDGFLRQKTPRNDTENYRFRSITNYH